MTDTSRPNRSDAEQPELSGARDTSPKRSKRSPSAWKRLTGSAALVGFGVVVLILAYSFVYRAFIDPPVEPEIMQGSRTHVIQLDVLNATGTPKLSQRFTDYLRARGFDVVEIGNYRESDLAFTRVIDRAGNMQAAHQVARALGVSDQRVVQEIDRNRYLDVTVVIGKDFRSLKPMQ
ncbi:MAG: LytR family transcriptional regulator [Ignavibacteria bacterium]|nr:LytR family transcriptional regulator [Ignavibacteria bacterium]